MHAERLTNPARPGYRAEVRRIPASALLLVLSGSAGCSRGDAIARPTTVLATYVDAIAEHEYRAAYALLSESTRESLSYEAFVEHLERDASLTRLRLRSLERRPAATGPDATVTIEGEAIPFVLEADGFRIVGNPADAFDQSTPRGAVRAFGLALAERRADWLLALAPPSARELLDEETVRAALTEENEAAYAELADAIASATDASIETHANHATMRIGIRRLLRLVRVEGLWFIDGID